ncbi:hypothetical protein OG225_41445 (plasmid) [Nocardia sp. NBC_01377]|uniref:MazG nucleotide pyrophosphohydrolase domain-containing protein n=1 Tax=Nocardia sp. NBC_01377 TaxID=2903595 RepID=UPI00324514A5
MTPTEPPQLAVVWIPTAQTPAADLEKARATGVARVGQAAVAVVIGPTTSHVNSIAQGSISVWCAPDRRHEIRIHVTTWDQVRTAVTPVLLALVAYRNGMLYLSGHIIESNAAGLLVLGDDSDGHAQPRSVPHLLIDAHLDPPEACILTEESVWETRARAVEPVAVKAIVVVDEQDRYLPAKAVITHLRAALGSPVAVLAPMFGGPEATTSLAEVDRVAEAHIHSLASALTAACVQHRRVGGWRDGAIVDLPFGSVPVVYPAGALAGLRTMQSVAAQVFGRPESERALSWMLEEAGEVAKAIRRCESPARIGQELAQLLHWVFCVANIGEVDLAEHAERALGHEVLRQLDTHGALRPSRSPAFREPR